MADYRRAICVLTRQKRRFLGLKREIRRRFPYRSYGKASIFVGLLALLSGRWFR
jgi:hypothetical protein